eukprot:CAMPEP_0172417676 /NCGR_PEP_ID=MMETSP1064-20121228/4208_1 /TAXON_ID=202472 /ORGANISM="Aulacoseira subarctica , Strain CCAP 1002/5" /LENGTH=131 /DNA_ID=CAMNT_0013156165 /DNA_START=29 /DNA_END=421 /DNA_ORIENTATION=+
MVKNEAKITIVKKETKKETKKEVEELKPGQKYPTPTPGFADRVFYETLLRQRPGSEMAQEWCVSYGVLPDDEAIKLYDKVMKRKKIKTGGSPSKSEVAAAKNTKKRKTNNIHDDVAVDVGMQVGGEEGIGT